MKWVGRVGILIEIRGGDSDNEMKGISYSEMRYRS